VLVLDEGSKKIIDNVVKEDDILNENIASRSSNAKVLEQI
jgi:syntaxin-binding protein 1